jgi:hypothetical protein
MLPRAFLSSAAALAALAPALPRAAPPPARPPFVDRTRETGLDFVHLNGMSGRLYILEIIGAGGALLDYDGDGDLDLYAVQGGPLGPGAPAGPGDRLYRNDLTGPDGARSIRFVDVTGSAGVRPTGYGMGATTGDFDNDGWTDLFLTRYGSSQLLRNRGDGTFVDVTQAVPAGGPRWSTAASAFDYDRDGWLDLYVGGYLDFSYESHTVCRAASTAPDYCGPKQYRGVPARLLRNHGGGRFEDATAKAGVAGPPMKTLGTVAFDADEDGWPDLYVANDGEPNALWINRGGQSFQDEGLLAGVAVNRQGLPDGSMGVDAADFDQDGDDDLFMTNLTNEKNALFVSLRADTPQPLFEDRSLESGLGAPSLPMTGFGTLFTDYDRDGWLDLPVANGAVYRIEEQARAGVSLPLRQRRQLFRNLGDGTFADATGGAGAAFAQEEVGRGLAAGDLDNDGDADLVVFNNHGPARVLINEAADGRPWIGLRLLTGTPGRDALGARVTVERADGRTLHRRVHSDGSYLSASDPRLQVGLGPAGGVRRVIVRWPDGGVEEWGTLEAGRYHTLRRGTGRAAGAR